MIKGSPQGILSRTILAIVWVGAMLSALTRALLILAALATVFILLMIICVFSVRHKSEMTCRVIARWELEDDLQHIYSAEAAAHATQT